MRWAALAGYVSSLELARICAGGAARSPRAQRCRWCVGGDASGRNVRVRGIDLGPTLHSYFLEDRHQLGSKCVERLLRFPDVDDSKALLPLPRDVGEQPGDRPVGGRFHPLFPAGELAHRLLVLLLRDTLEDEHDWHRYLLGSGTAAAYGAA